MSDPIVEGQTEAKKRKRDAATLSKEKKREPRKSSCYYDEQADLQISSDGVLFQVPAFILQAGS